MDFVKSNEMMKRKKPFGRGAFFVVYMTGFVIVFRKYQYSFNNAFFICIGFGSCFGAWTYGM